MKKSSKLHLNIALLGHVDSGKSTLAGHLLFLTNQVPQKQLDMLEAQSKDFGKPSFKYAWIMDRIKLSRQVGITIDISTRMFQTKNHNVTLIDTPGVAKYMKNLISGLAQATAVILVVACNSPEYEIGIGKTGHTEEYARAASYLGIKNVVICVNKMDLVDYSEERFNFVVKETTKMLVKLGYKDDSLTFVPVSGYHGLNLVEKSQKLSWYKGQTLLNIINNLPSQKIKESQPFRVSVHLPLKIGGIGVIVKGKVYSGQSNDEYVTMMPGEVKTRFRTFEINQKSVWKPFAGENIAANTVSVSLRQIRRGCVFYETKYKPKEVHTFVAEIVVLTIPNVIKNGFCPVIHVHTAHVACKFKKILALIDGRTKKQIENEPKQVKSNSRIIVEMEPIKSVVVEKYSECPGMGRFLIRDQGKIIGVGVVNEINYHEDSRRVKLS